jgi:hypothetical protein
MIKYILCDNEVAEPYAFDRFRRYQRSIGKTDEAIRSIWESCHTNIETRIQELPDNLEFVIE